MSVNRDERRRYNWLASSWAFLGFMFGVEAAVVAFSADRGGDQTWMWQGWSGLLVYTAAGAVLPAILFALVGHGFFNLRGKD